MSKNVFEHLIQHGNDNYFEGIEPEKSVNPVGSTAKIEEMARNVELGLNPCHSTDRPIINPKESNGGTYMETEKGYRKP